MDVVEFERKAQLRQQVACKHDGAAHHAQHQREFLGIRSVEARVEHIGHARDRRLHGILVEQQFRVLDQVTGTVVMKFLHGLLHGDEWG